MASRTKTNMKDVESKKEGIFTPEFDIDGGDIVFDDNTSESFVVSAVHSETDGNKTLSKVSTMMKCNSDLSVQGYIQTADDRGNLITEFADKYSDIPCFLEQISNELKQYDSGLHPETEFKIYTSAALKVEEIDKAQIDLQGNVEDFKIVAIDYMTFPNMLVLQVCRDVRE